MYLNESCDVCVCDKGFKKEAPFCRPIRCNVEAVSGQDLAEHGAPVYLKGSTCCPSTWITGERHDHRQLRSSFSKHNFFDSFCHLQMIWMIKSKHLLKMWEMNHQVM